MGDVLEESTREHSQHFNSSSNNNRVSADPVRLYRPDANILVLKDRRYAGLSLRAC